MKKNIVLLLSILLLLTFAGSGCTKKPAENASTGNPSVPASQTNGQQSTGKEGETVLWSLCENQAVLQLINDYFSALKNGDEDLMQKTLVAEADIDTVFLIVQSRVYEDFRNIRVYSCRGLQDDELCLFVLADAKFVNIETPATKSFAMYARTDQNLQVTRLMTDAELMAEKKAADAEAAASGKKAAENAYSCYVTNFDKSDYIKQIYADASKAYTDALSGDRVLAYYVDRFEQGDFDVPTLATSSSEDAAGTSSAVGGETTASEEETTVPTTPEPPFPTAAGETILETAKTGYVTENAVRVRSVPDTGSNNTVLMKLGMQHRVLIIGELDEWYHIRDILTEDAEGMHQNPSDLDGYIFKDYIQVEDSQQP